MRNAAHETPNEPSCTWCGYRGDTSELWWLTATQDHLQEELICDLCNHNLIAPAITREELRAQRGLDQRLFERGREMAEAVHDEMENDHAELEERMQTWGIGHKRITPEMTLAELAELGINVDGYPPEVKTFGDILAGGGRAPEPQEQEHLDKPPMEPTPLIKWISEQPEFQEGYSLSTLDGIPLFGPAEAATEMRSMLRQAAEFSLSQPEFLDKLRQSPSYNKASRADTHKVLRSLGVSEELIARLPEPTPPQRGNMYTQEDFIQALQDVLTSHPSKDPEYQRKEKDYLERLAGVIAERHMLLTHDAFWDAIAEAGINPKFASHVLDRIDDQERFFADTPPSDDAR